MFCPKDHVTLFEVHEFLKDHAWTISEAEQNFDGEGQGLNRHLFRQWTGPDGEDIETLTNAYAWWLMLAFLEVHSAEVRIAAPTGAVLRAPAILTDSDALLIIPWAPWEDGPLPIEFPDDLNGIRMIARVDLRHIDRFAFTVDADKDGFAEASKGLRHVNGMPLCVPDDLLPLNDQISGHILEALKSKYSGDEARRVGEQMDNLVERVIKFVECTGATREAARKALGGGCKIEHWRAVWREASRLRPDLQMSRPGPKGKQSS